MQAKNWMAAALVVSGSLFSQRASADMLKGLGHWQGHGTVYGADGRASGDFTVELERAKLDPHSVETRGKIKLPTGQEMPFESRVTRAGSGFTLESARGKGSGHCFGADFCHSYEDTGNGKGSAMTIVFDGPNEIRILTTELEQGKPVQYMRQVLIRPVSPELVSPRSVSPEPVLPRPVSPRN